jgi:hypothetical protein
MRFHPRFPRLFGAFCLGVYEVALDAGSLTWSP